MFMYTYFAVDGGFFFFSRSNPLLASDSGRLVLLFLVAIQHLRLPSRMHNQQLPSYTRHVHLSTFSSNCLWRRTVWMCVDVINAKPYGFAWCVNLLRNNNEEHIHRKKSMHQIHIPFKEIAPNKESSS